MLVSNTAATNDSNMGCVFISEKSNMDCRDITCTEVHDKHGVFYVSFDANLHSFGVINRNGRQYLADNVWKSITESEKIQSLLADNAWFGEMNHPTPYIKGEQFTPERLQNPALENRSHKIMRPRINGNLLQAHIETASGTDVGVGFAKEIIQGLKPAFSCRAVAVMQMMNGKPTVIIRRLITYDWVLFPSHKEAHMITEPKLVEKCADIYSESADSNNNYCEDFIMPLKDILKESSEDDPNANTIMESFDLSLDDLVGFDNTHKHMIVKDNNNTIYANISPKTKKRVDDFFASFK
jgi:hypothetical protein